MAIRISLDSRWRFSLGNFCDIEKDFNYGGGDLAGSTKTGDHAGAVRPDFNDSEWRTVDLPHDWAVELPCVQEADPYHAYRPLGRPFPETSIGWYRRELTIPAEDEGYRLHLVFDGVFRDSIVWLNGHYLGRHLSGYTGFRYDISDYADYGGKNVVVVRVDASQFEGWFYEGAGIYRHVWLERTSRLHLSPGGVAVRCEIGNGEGSSVAGVRIEARVENSGDEEAGYQLELKIGDSDGTTVAQERTPRESIGHWQSAEIDSNLSVPSPRLWSVEDPYLYNLTITLLSDGFATDSREISFGIRSVRFDTAAGFSLNGRALTLKGVCCHQDAAGVGVAVPDGLWPYRIRKLKEMGCNAYRCAHNPPAPEFLDACDRLGMLVIDENRIMGSSSECLSRLTSMIKRDRNHPSVILWCLGNEEHVIQGSAVGARIVATMKKVAQRHDPTRLVTSAMNGDWGSEFSLINDVHGCNYIACGDVDEFHASNPMHPVVASETASTLCTRGVYGDFPDRGYANSYGRNLPGWGASAADMWRYWRSRPFVAGVFVWTGFDYRGEPLPYNWPCVNSNFGVMDICGFPKDSYYYYKAWWTDDPVLHLFPHWNWGGREGESIDVRCYGNCEEVELFLNGRSLGRRAMERDSLLEWRVPYEPGRLEAKGYTGGVEVLTAVRETTGEPAAIHLSADRQEMLADGADTVVINISLNDASGRVVPTADNEVVFLITGGATILGVGNGDPSFHDPEKSDRCKSFNGRCQVLVQAGSKPGKFTVEAGALGILPDKLTIQMR